MYLVSLEKNLNHLPIFTVAVWLTKTKHGQEYEILYKIQPKQCTWFALFSRFAWIYFCILYLCISCSSHTYLDNTSACDANGNNVDKQTISEHNENITTIYIKVMCMYSIHAAKRIWSLPGLAYFFCSKRCKLALNQQLGQKSVANALKYCMQQHSIIDKNLPREKKNSINTSGRLHL